MPMPASSVWKMMKTARLALLQLLDQLILDDHLRVAGERMAAQERRVPDVLVVDLEAEPRRQQHAERRKHAQHALAVGEALEIDGEADVVAVLGRHALHQRAHLVLGARRRRLAHHLPVAVLGLDGAALGQLCRCGALDRPAGSSQSIATGSAPAAPASAERRIMRARQIPRATQIRLAVVSKTLRSEPAECVTIASCRGMNLLVSGCKCETAADKAGRRAGAVLQQGIPRLRRPGHLASRTRRCGCAL